MTFDWYEGTMVFCVFIFIFLIRTSSEKEHLDKNNFCHVYGNYFEIAILKVAWYQLSSKFFINNNKGHQQQHLKDTLQLKNLRTWIDIGANCFLGTYHETKMHEGAQKTISCTKIWPCFLKNISLTIVFLFSETNLVFINSTCCSFNDFLQNLFTFLPFDILCILELIMFLFSMILSYLQTAKGIAVLDNSL